MAAAVAADYRAVIEAARAAEAGDAAHGAGPLARLRRTLHAIAARDHFPPPEREEAQAAVERLAALAGARRDLGDAGGLPRRPGRCAWLIAASSTPPPSSSSSPIPTRCPRGRRRSTCAASTSRTARATAASRLPGALRLDDPALAEIARIVHEADLADERYDAPEAPGSTPWYGASRHAHDPELLDSRRRSSTASTS